MTMIDPSRPGNQLVQGENPSQQIVQLFNPGPDTWTGQYANQKYRAEPGQRIFIPFFGLCYWFGHPDAIDVPGDRQKQYRLEELRRLQVLYGTYDDMAEFDATKPNVEVYDGTTGDRIITVCDDPAGSHLVPGLEDKQQIDLLQENMARMQTQMAAMEKLIQAQQRADDAEAQAGSAAMPSDTPRPIKSTEKIAQGAPTVPMPEGVPTAPPSVDVTVDGPPAKDVPNVPRQG